ncbi:MAG: polyprenyl synthetase family protein [Deltaproteobacteria bacterium]|nr:polyprenyl synthetase family protein [Deltaproteobacteria bacterium]
MKALKQRILDAIQADLPAIEDALRDNLEPYLPVVSHVADYIMFAGGKRIRPVLMVLCARVCGYKGSYDKTLSVAFEYLHAATLLHDDLVDGAEVRRGNPVAHGIWGNPAVVLVGDFLLARSVSLAARSGRMSIVEAICRTTAEMSEGEIYQLLHKGDLTLTESRYMDVIRRKTACLIQTACRVGALLAEAPESKVQALDAYGYNLGCAFQIVDDVLDYTADEKTLGKAIGTDLREGKVTLPLIYALGRAHPEDRDTMEAVFGAETITKTDLEMMIELVKRYGGIAYAKGRAKALADQARNCLDLFEPSPTRNVLEAMAEYVLVRQV